MTPAEFVGVMFLSRDVAHSKHLNTHSYAEHMALGEFYSGIVGVADSFAEAYQGKHGLMGPILVKYSDPAVSSVKFLKTQHDLLERERYSVVDSDCTTLQNLIDAVLEVYLSAIYKLRFLS